MSGGIVWLALGRGRPWVDEWVAAVENGVGVGVRVLTA
jgi:hypothetical protein